MELLTAHTIILGAGAAGMRAALSAAQHCPDKPIYVVSKTQSMRSQTGLAEGGASGVLIGEDTYRSHFLDTIAAGKGMSLPSVVQYFVEEAPHRLSELSDWGCPWSKTADGDIACRNLGGMSAPRSWFAADATGFQILKTLFQQALRYENIIFLEEFYCVDLMYIDHVLCGVLLLHTLTGKFIGLKGRSVVMATGGVGAVYSYHTNGLLTTGDGIVQAFRHGVPLRDLEFIQFHPTALPHNGRLITEACRSIGGWLLNAQGERYLADYGLGPASPELQPNRMELSTRDQLCYAFYQERQKKRTGKFEAHEVVYLDLRHLSLASYLQHIPQAYQLLRSTLSLDPKRELIPVRPAAHYTMGGIFTNLKTETTIEGLFAAGECASIGLHGANRLGSNSLSECLVFGKVAGDQAAQYQPSKQTISDHLLRHWCSEQQKRLASLLAGTHNFSFQSTHWHIRAQLHQIMEAYGSMVRNERGLQTALNQLQKYKAEYETLKVPIDSRQPYQQALVHHLETGHLLTLGACILVGSLARKESRGSYQRDDYPDSNEKPFHTLLHDKRQELPHVEHVYAAIA